MVNSLLLGAAAGLATFTAVIHVFAGGPRIVRPLLAADLEPQIKWLSYLCWHLGTVSTLFIAAGFAASVLDPTRTDYAWIAMCGALSFVAVAILVATKSGLPLRRIPVVPMFSLVSLLGGIGLLI
ncbi:MAG: hypothetical protein AAF437_01070 [Pseudomonadota bacterium]